MIDAVEKDLFSSYCEKHGVMHVRRWQLNRKSFLKEETNKYEAMFFKKNDAKRNSKPIKVLKMNTVILFYFYLKE